MPQPLSVLLRKQAVQEVYMKYAPIGVTNARIFRQYVYPKWGISERTFYNYIQSRPARSEIERNFPVQAKLIFETPEKK